MKERPILFSAPMVRALLAGTKTQTRRALKHEAPDGVDACCWLDIDGVHTFVWVTGEDQDIHPSAEQFACPYGQPGDRLWVREAWARDDEDGALFYRADVGSGNEADDWERNRLDGVGRYRWRPSIHMPRAASRITLEVASVRVERLQDINDLDAQAEGCAYNERYRGYCVGEAMHYHSGDPRQSFFSLWETINGYGSVDANPWVWAVEFKRIGAAA